MTTPLHPIRDLILPMLVNGTTWRHMLATAIHYRNEATDGDIEASLDELRDLGYEIHEHDDPDGVRYELVQPEGAA